MKALGNMIFSLFKGDWQGTGPFTAISLLSLLIGKNPESGNTINKNACCLKKSEQQLTKKKVSNMFGHNT